MATLWKMTGEDIGVEGEIPAQEESTIDAVLAESSPDTTETYENAEALETGTDSLGELDDVADNMEAVEESGEPISPITAESFRARVNGAVRRFGIRQAHADMGDRTAQLAMSTISRLSGENFRSDISASARRGSIGLCAEGVRDIAKDAMAKIREWIKKIKEKAIAFWNKHFSSLGRVEKALEKLKNRVGEHSGKMASNGYEDKAPSSLADAFPETGGIEKSVVSAYISNHKTMTEGVKVETLATLADALGGLSSTTNLAEVKQKTATFADEIVKKVDQSKKLVYGLEQTADFTSSGTGSSTTAQVDNEDFEIRLEKEIDADKDPSAGCAVLNKEAAKELLNTVIEVIRLTIKLRDKQHKINEAVSKAMDKIYKGIGDASGSGTNGKASADEKKSMRFAARSCYRVIAFAEKFIATMFNSNVRLAKAVAMYVKFSMSRWKSA